MFVVSRRMALQMLLALPALLAPFASKGDSTVDYDFSEQVTIARLDGIDATQLFQNLQLPITEEDQARTSRKEFVTDDRRISIRCSRKLVYSTATDPIYSCQIQLNEKRKSDTTQIESGPNATRIATLQDVTEAKYLFQSLGGATLTLARGQQIRQFHSYDGKTRLVCENDPAAGPGDTQCRVMISLKL